MMRIYELGSTSGATVEFVVFLFLSLGLALAVYGLLVRASSRRPPFQAQPAARGPVAAITGTLVFGLLFGGLYATTLRGFYRVELSEDEVRLYYLFPAHTVTLPRVELAQAERVPVHKDRGHLRLHTHQGATYQSALASDRVVLESWEGLNAYLDSAGQP
jgi:hypothetical protein